jgi:hypothetical protein
VSLLPDRNAERRNECRTVEHDSFSLYVKKCAFKSCNTVGSRFCEGFLLLFFLIFCSGSLGIWAVENTPLGARAYHEFVWVSWCHVRSGVCVPAYWHMAVQRQDLIARLTGRHEKMPTIKLCGLKTAADPSVHWQASIHQFTWQRGMNKWWNCVNGTLLQLL